MMTWHADVLHNSPGGLASQPCITCTRLNRWPYLEKVHTRCPCGTHLYISFQLQVYLYEIIASVVASIFACDHAWPPNPYSCCAQLGTGTCLTHTMATKPARAEAAVA